MPDGRDSRWPARVLAAASIAGVLVAWGRLLSAPDLALQVATAGGGLTPRQAQIEQVVERARRAAPGATEVLALSADAEEIAFARYVLYPALVSYGPVGPRPAVRAALDSLPAGALVLVSRHGDLEKLEDVERLARRASPRLRELARASDDVVLYLVLP